MGYGVLRIDFKTLKDALCLPENCQITAIRHFYDGGARAQGDLVIASEDFPDSPVDDLPLLLAHGTLEKCPDHAHLPEDGFECKKIAVRLEVSSSRSNN